MNSIHRIPPHPIPQAISPAQSLPQETTPALLDPTASSRRRFCISATLALAAGTLPASPALPSGDPPSPAPSPAPSDLAPPELASPDLAPPELGSRLSDAQAAAIAQLALSGIDREYPNKPSQVMRGPEDVLSPKQMHPSFYGCFDWHSSVHGHWVLVRLLRHNPNHPFVSLSRQKLTTSLTEANLLAEAKYFDSKENRSFERMYGWAWLLQLAAELHSFDDADARLWRKAIRPLENKIVELTTDYLPRLSFPIRTGVHPDTAFALGLTIDYAKTVGDDPLLSLVVQRARAYYLQDRAASAAFEPSGEDFFSPTLNEADLMRRVLPPAEFTPWLRAFLPELDPSKETNPNSKLLQPVEVSDVTDGKLVHLAGLDFSRAWCMLGIAKSLANSDPLRTKLHESARNHARVGFRYVFSGHYEGEHWLGTFALFALAASQENT
ncbi:DUF2891 domain-containing protein [Pirellulaceae bacterium SH501]